MPLAPNDLTDTALSGDIIVYPGQSNATLQNTSNVQTVVGQVNASKPNLNVLEAQASTTAITGASVVVTGATLPVTVGTWLVDGGLQIANTSGHSAAFSGWLGMSSGVGTSYGSLAEEIDGVANGNYAGLDLGGYVVVTTSGTLQAYAGSDFSGASVVTSASIGASGVPTSGFVAVQVR